ncbi:MAG TPA: hypothetical protein DCE71_07435 [Parachlamydiales bacterium]|mgnify:CR=1 FL=1|nr:hypothetical protein [Parachlamydiales bacterium]
MSHRSLNFSEWFVVSFFLMLLASLVVISKVSSWKAKNLLSEMAPLETRKIEISGEVLRPGVYELRSRSTCKEALERAHPKRFADLSHIDLTALAPAYLMVPRLENLRVLLEGEGVEPCELSVPVGFRYCDLKSKILLRENGDPSVFRSRKMLSDKEVIFVEKRK